MNDLISIFLLLTAIGIFLAGRYDWIPKGFPRGVSRIVAVYLAILALGFFISPLMETGL